MDRFVRSAQRSSDNPPTLADFGAWERSRSVLLPEDFKTFMARYNGGFIYPEAFNHQIHTNHDWYDGPSEAIRIDTIFYWSEFIDRNTATVTPWKYGDFVAIGHATDGFILMCLRDENFGSVRYWWRNSPYWNDEDDEPIYGDVADSFKDFIMAKLFLADRPSSRWDRPKCFDDAQKIRF